MYNNSGQIQYNGLDICSKLLNEIRDSYREKKLIPFIGAGFSKNIRNFPDWEEFIDTLQRDINLEEDFFKKNFNDDYLEATEYYIIKKGEQLKDVLKEGEDPYLKGRQELIRLIRKQFENKRHDIREWLVHNELIKACNFGVIFTTNWDDTLEETCVGLGKTCTKIIIEKNFREYLGTYLKNSTHKQIIKFHGDCKRDDSIIACETDYYRRISQLCALDIKFMNDLLHYDFIFLGHSFHDINIKYIFHQMYAILSQIPSDSKPNIYFVTLDKTTAPRAELLTSRRNIKVFCLYDLLRLRNERYPKDRDYLEVKGYKFVFDPLSEECPYSEQNGNIYIKMSNIEQIDQIRKKLSGDLNREGSVKQSSGPSENRLDKFNKAYEEFIFQMNKYLNLELLKYICE